ncbi:hypothetical protein A2U01_0084254, partial [Trifolium medium]|nr:hypothetical protein [Trifolium medium]
KKVEKERSETDSDDGAALAEKFKQKNQSEASKATQKYPSKGKSSELILDQSSEAQAEPILGHTIPLNTILPENETV